MRPLEAVDLSDGAAEVSPAALGRLVTADGERPQVWHLAEEAPVSILVGGEPFAVVMATPADLHDFAVGFAVTEGIVAGPEAIRRVAVAPLADGYAVNLAVEGAVTDGRRRTLPGRSSCGICGSATLEAALPALARVAWRPSPSPEALRAAYRALPDRQAMNRANRSTHAAALCGPDGAIELLREDIGRHTALDKLAGAAFRDGLDTAQRFVLLSSRVSVEMVQKAAALGVPFVAAVSAPSALALRQARRAGIGIAGRAREGIMIFEAAGEGDRPA